MSTPLIPPDLERCQAERSNGANFMTLGGVHRMVRCSNKPVVIATETAPGTDGQTGSMSLCAECAAAMRRMMREGYATIEPIYPKPDMIQFLKDRAVDGAPFHVDQYKKSDGGVVDLVVRFARPDEYKQDLLKSYEALDKAPLVEFTDDYATARQEVLDSLRKQLDGPADSDGDKPKQRASYEDLTPINDFLAYKDGDRTKIVAYRLIVVSENLTTLPRKAVTSKTRVSALKKEINAALPLSRHTFRLNLYAENYESIHI